MLKRSVLDLNFVEGRISSPTIEVNVESIEKSGVTFYEIVSKALTEYALSHKGAVSTVYLCGGASVNFGEYSSSEFLIIPSNPGVLEFLKVRFERIVGIQSRFSDYMYPSEGLKAFHLEEGMLWEPEDMMNWYSLAVEKSQFNVESDLETSAVGDEFFTDPDGLLVESNEFSEEDDFRFIVSAPNQSKKTISSKTTQNARYRAARSDARIGHIKREIERVFGLPVGSVSLIGPDGSSLRSDAFIRTLHKRWED
ncbi:hypothetical protein H8K35_08305 [Undibacterium sp. LX40W]|uniref:Uncharacterized protein n=1 Tax=Undibacterium nitidum TaxID=2762298 RepID=A0A923KTG5_9BURK|nr:MULTISPECIES: hypothetical protein [Undibacterium]MBC3881564.1 hypothetical protein [Undibacterium nitidum]MBC3891654.1 hypothetical protein [Undibacterium sp. LX40W]